MADSVAGKRITEFTELSNIGTGDFIAVDNASQDTKKYDATKLATKTYADTKVSDAIDNLTIPTAKIEDGAVTTAKIADANVTTAKIANSAVNEGKIADSAVTSNKINNGAVATAKIADGAVNTDKLGAGAVTSAKLGAGSVTNTKIAENAVRNEHITDDAVTSGKLASNAVTEAKIYEGAVTTDKLGASAVTTAKISDSAVTTGKINDSAVTEGKIANSAVKTAKINDGAVTTAKINDSAVTTAKINNGAVTTDKLASSAVTEGKIGSGAVTEGKIGSGAVSTAKLADSAVTEDKLASSSVSESKIANGAVTEDKLGEDVAKILDNKAEINGYYDEMSVGSAEQLLSNIYEPDNTPYLFRTSGGSLEIGDRVYEDALIGGSVAWNQLVALNVNAFTVASRASLTTDSASNAFILLSTTDNTDMLKGCKKELEKNKVYIISCKTKRTMQDKNGHFGLTDATNDYRVSTFSKYLNITTDDYMNRTLVVKTDSDYYNFAIATSTSTPNGEGVYVKDLILTDLTLMFGSTIADYIYSLEQSEAGSGIAWLKSYGFFTKDYYAYNAGQLMSVKTSAKKVVGFNAYDNATGKAKLVGGHEYQITGAYTALSYSTGETITPDANGKFTPSADGELTVTGGNATNTCVHLVWDGERDGEYEAYEEHTYPLDSDLELRGIPKLDSNNKLYYDGDVYESDGTVTRKYGIVDLGSLTWVYYTTSGRNYFGVGKTDRMVKGDMICSKYLYSGNTYDSGMVDKEDKTLWGDMTTGVIKIKDSAYTDATTFKTAMSGVYLVYELATPTTESADPYTNPQIVSNWGTEEFVDTRDVPVPVGHDSRYLPDLKAKIESAPNNPSTNGKYFLQYENGQATYVPVPSEVPQTPSEDGTYVLKATVSSGVATLAWVAEE